MSGISPTITSGPARRVDLEAAPIWHSRIAQRHPTTNSGSRMMLRELSMYIDSGHGCLPCRYSTRPGLDADCAQNQDDARRACALAPVYPIPGGKPTLGIKKKTFSGVHPGLPGPASGAEPRLAEEKPAFWWLGLPGVPASCFRSAGRQLADSRETRQAALWKTGRKQGEPPSNFDRRLRREPDQRIAAGHDGQGLLDCLQQPDGDLASQQSEEVNPATAFCLSGPQAFSPRRPSGICRFPGDCPELAEVIQLSCIPRFTTFQKAGEPTADHREAPVKGRNTLLPLKALIQHSSFPVAFLDRKMTTHRRGSAPRKSFARHRLEPSGDAFPEHPFFSPANCAMNCVSDR